MEWFLLTHEQFAMENEENEFKAGFRACLNQTGMKLIWNWECGLQTVSRQKHVFKPQIPISSSLPSFLKEPR